MTNALVDLLLRACAAGIAEARRQAGERGVFDAVVLLCDRADDLGRRLSDELAALGALGPAGPDDRVTILAVTPDGAETFLDQLVARDLDVATVESHEAGTTTVVVAAGCVRRAVPAAALC